MGYLVYLNHDNYDRRQQMVSESLQSLNRVTCQPDVDVLIVNNGGGKLARDVIQKHVRGPHSYVELTANFMDVSVHYCSLWTALNNRSDYVAYAYDDFVFYDERWVADSIVFMDSSPKVSCLRLPRYVYRSSFFDSDKTLKSKNPDAVNHAVGANNRKLWFDENPTHVGHHLFYQCNWRPNSRPTLWRTPVLQDVIDRHKTVPVMQAFEKIMYDYADARGSEWICGFIDGGVCHTFPTTTSERVRTPTQHIQIDVSTLRNVYDINRR